eukprot:753819-Hanusia_phi.AAC.1
MSLMGGSHESVSTSSLSKPLLKRKISGKAMGVSKDAGGDDYVPNESIGVKNIGRRYEVKREMTTIAMQKETGCVQRWTGDPYNLRLWRRPTRFSKQVTFETLAKASKFDCFPCRGRATSDPIDAEMLGRFIASAFAGQCFSVGQDFLIDFQGNSLTLRVTELEVSDRERERDAVLSVPAADSQGRWSADGGKDTASKGGRRRSISHGYSEQVVAGYSWEISGDIAFSVILVKR